MQKNGYTFATVYSSKCVSVFLHQTISKNVINICIVLSPWNIIDKILTLWNISVCVQSRESEILSEWSLQAGAYLAQWLQGGN